MKPRAASSFGRLSTTIKPANAMMPKTFIVILQYNNSQDTIRCLNSVKELDYPTYNVIIVDNGSEVNPVKSRNAGTLKELFDGVKHINEVRNWIRKEGNLNPATHYSLLTTHYNSGYSGGNNIGIKHAIENEADYVLILNPDTTLEKDVLTKLVKVAVSDPHVGILGPTIDEGNRIIHGSRVEWLKPELRHSPSLTTNYKLQTTNYYIPGAAILIKRKVVKKIGLLDERYFLYFEDADYCERAKRAGFKLAIVPETLVHHRPSSSTSSLGAPLLLRYHFRNAHLFNWKNGPFWVKFLLPLWSVFIIIKQFIKIIFVPTKREISMAILTGVMDFYKNKLGKIEI